MPVPTNMKSDNHWYSTHAVISKDSLLRAYQLYSHHLN